MSYKRMKLVPLILVVFMLCSGLAVAAGLLSGHSGSEAIAQIETQGVTVANDVAAESGYGNQQPISQNPLETSAPEKYKFTGGMVISGRVTDPDGRGIAGVPVDARPASPGAAAAPAPVTTDDKGNYTIDVASPGVFKVLFLGGEASGGVWASRWYDGKTSEVVTEPVPVGASGVDAVLIPTGVLKGQVEFNSKPFAVDVIAFRADVEQNVGEGGTDPLTGQPGNFSFTSLDPGDYKLLFIPDISEGLEDKGETGPFWYGGTDWTSAATVHIAAGKTTDLGVSFPPQSGVSVFGTVGYDREAYSSAAVALVDEGKQEEVIAEDSDVVNPSYLSMFSFFQFNGVPPGNYKLRCTLPDGRVIWYLEGSQGGTEEFSQATIIKIEKPTLAVGKLFFGATSLPASFTGQVIRSDNSPVADRRVYAFRMTADGERIANSFYPLTDGSGRYDGNLSPGTYRICTVDWMSAKQYCREPVVAEKNASLAIPVLTMPQDTPILQ
ncbi:MAG: carboxypeptidase-like regulatory domain-containing protein [Thermoleophilia bacterium]